MCTVQYLVKIKFCWKKKLKVKSGLGKYMHMTCLFSAKVARLTSVGKSNLSFPWTWVKHKFTFYSQTVPIVRVFHILAYCHGFILAGTYRQASSPSSCWRRSETCSKGILQTQGHWQRGIQGYPQKGSSTGLSQKSICKLYMFYVSGQPQDTSVLLVASADLAPSNYSYLRANQCSRFLFGQGLLLCALLDLDWGP